MRRKHATINTDSDFNSCNKTARGFIQEGAEQRQLSVFQGLQMLGAPQKAAHCRYASLEPASKGNSNKNVALAKETTPITLERQKINHF